MEDVKELISTTLGEINEMISTKTVIGEPIAVGEVTIVPLISASFGFGVGGSSGASRLRQSAEREGAGSTGGAMVRPVAVVIMDKEGIRVEPVPGSLASALERASEVLPRTAERLAAEAEKVFEDWLMRREKREA